ncbi:hypothetical protein D3C85_1940330 [compost metagenome]
MHCHKNDIDAASLTEPELTFLRVDVPHLRKFSPVVYPDQFPHFVQIARFQFLR